ncbi:MAG: universal stress protein [Pseudomonadota bacterium]
MKKLFVPLIGQHDPEDPTELERPALEAACSLARRLESHVEAVSLIEPPAKARKGWPFWLPGAGMSQMCDMLDAASEVRRKHAAASFDAVMAEHDNAPLQTAEPTPGFTAHFAETVGDIEHTVGPLARLSDLTVLSSPRASWAEPFTPLVRACLTDTGRPVLVAPMEAASLATHAAIAWDGSEAAARTLAVGLPLLKLSTKITVISAEESGKPDRNPEDVVEYLAWHGLSAEAVSVPVDGEAPDKAVYDTALDLGSDLLFLGARLHTRAHRIFYGSMTERVLNEPRIPALLA